MRVLGLIAVTFAAGALAVPALFAQDAAPANDEGTMIQIGPDRGVEVDVRVDGERAAERRGRRLGRRALTRPGFVEAPPAAVSRYYIGVAGEPLPAELRAQLSIEPEEGILIRSVTPEGPAAEAGVEQYDIVLRANGKPVNQIFQLADVVGEQGEVKGRITLDMLRAGKPKTAWVSPVERPAGVIAAAPPRRERLGLFGPQGVIGPEVLEGLLQDGGLLGGQGGLGGFAEVMPQMGVGGVSVSVSRQNEGPAKVTVQSGDQTWEFDEGDEEALAALPENVRPTVERMLNQNGGVLPPGFEGFGLNAPGFQMQLEGEDLAGRIRAMQERMRALQGGFNNPDQGAIEPPIELDEAPAFNAEPLDAQPQEVEPEGPVELEIPLEPTPAAE